MLSSEAEEGPPRSKRAVATDEADDEVRPLFCPATTVAPHTRAQPSETPDEARVRLSRALLARVAQRSPSGSDDDGDADQEAPPGAPHDRIARRLLRAAAKSGGVPGNQATRSPLAGLAGEHAWTPLHEGAGLGGHGLSPTCMAPVGEGAERCVTGAKDGIVRLYDVATCTRLWCSSRRPYEPAVHAVAALPDDVNTVVCGGIASGGQLTVWDTRQAAPAAQLPGHRGAVTALCADRESIWSAGLDLTLKQWDVRQLAYLTTSYGHQERVNALVSTGPQRQLSCSDDKSVHVWHHEKSQQLVFRRPAPTQAVDCVASVARQHHATFVTGDQAGDVCLWNVARKKPTVVASAAHGGRWITAVHVVDTIAIRCVGRGFCLSLSSTVERAHTAPSGSYDGYVRLWDLGHQLAPVAAVPCAGFVSAIHAEWSHETHTLRLLVATGKEHRWGRWWSTGTDQATLGEAACQGARNAVLVANVVLGDAEE